MERALLKGTELAEFLGISRALAYRMMRNKEIPGVLRIGDSRAIRVDRRAVEEWIKQRSGQDCGECAGVS